MIDDDPLWYKDAILYELHVRAFHDSVGEGFGDFPGLTRKLDYLEDLGITAVWLLPFYPSPLKDDGYDIASYTDVHPQYGSLADFKIFLEEAHRRGIRVITELVINHTSDQHPWFQRARRAPPGSPERDFYVWSDTPEKYKDARIIFKDFEPSNWTWDPLAQAHYWHRFYSHQPDLNFDNPAVWDAIFPVVDFWLEMGIDGMRLDAVPYLFEREGTNCENLPETHVFLKALRKHVDDRYPNRVFLAEANQWPEDAVAYFGDGDECQMCFHFPVMPRLFMALHQEDRFPILDILEQTPAIPDNCQWSLFLRNHDELTLEMVTDEERDYMYRAYAQDKNARINLGIRHRLAPLLKNDRRRIELMNALLLSLPGTPVIYYGDEIGMGDNIYLGDRNGVRTPMQWSADRNAGFSRANPQKLYLPIIIDPEYHFEAINAEAQQNNPSSLLWWMKRLIGQRKRHKAFGRGSFTFLRPSNPKVLAFIRKYRDEEILVVANLSRFVQFAELDLKEYKGVVPEEMFGRTNFPRIGELPYLLTLSPHGFYWFTLPPAKPTIVAATKDPRADEIDLPVLADSRSLAKHLHPSEWDVLEAILPGFLVRRFGDTLPSRITAARIKDAFPTDVGGIEIGFLIVRVEYRDAIPEIMSLTLTYVPDDQVDRLLMPLAACGIARLKGSAAGVLCHALAVPGCCRGVLQAILTGRVVRSDEHAIAAAPLFSELGAVPPVDEELPVVYRRSERNNAAVVFGEQFFLKSFRRIEDGIHPDLEVGGYLSRLKDDPGIAPVVGRIEYHRRGQAPATLAVLHRFVPNQGTGWQYTLDHLSGYFERVAALAPEKRSHPPGHSSLFEQTNAAADIWQELIGGHPNAVADLWQELIGGYFESARLIAKRTATIHQALAANVLDPAFVPEPFGNKLHQRSLYQAARNLVGRLCRRLEFARPQLPEPARGLAERLAAKHDDMLGRFRVLLNPAIGGARIRVHGDYHLGQLLWTGKEFVVSDFEGEPERTIFERRVKRSPLRDVVAMIRSFDYAAHSVLYGLATSRGRSPGHIRSEDLPILEPWASAWYHRVAREFTLSYLEAIAPANLLPHSDAIGRQLLESLVLEKALQEVDSELTVRPSWAIISMRAALQMLDRGAPGGIS